MLRLLCCQVLKLLLINASLPAVQVGRLGTDTLALHDELVSEDHDEIQWDTQVGSDEVLVVPLAVRAGARVLGQEVVETLEDGDEAAEEQTDVRTPDSARGDKSHGAVWNILSAARAHEVDVGHEDGDPGEETEDGDEVDKVLEDRHGGGVDTEEGEQAEERRQA